MAVHDRKKLYSRDPISIPDNCTILTTFPHSAVPGAARAARQHREGGGGRDQESGQGKAGRRQDRGRCGERHIEAERSRCSDHLCE